MKNDRQKKIIELVTDREIETQEELQRYLTENGFNVTQATVSRDIRELGLTKISDGRGSYRYAVQQNGAASSEKYMSILADAVIKAEAAENLVVIKTYPGMAQGAASALDNIDIGGIVGSIAGDDTILLVAKNSETADVAVSSIHRIVSGK